jgi:hypothetical protein
LPAQIVGITAVDAAATFEQRDGARDGAVVAHVGNHFADDARRACADALEHVLDHAGETECATVLGRVDLRDAVGFERGDFIRRNRAAAAHHHLDVRRAELAQHVDHVAEVFVVTALVTADGDAVRVLGDRGAHDVGNAAVVAEMHDLRATRLQQAADHVDGGRRARRTTRRRDERSGLPGSGGFMLLAGKMVTQE